MLEAIFDHLYVDPESVLETHPEVAVAEEIDNGLGFGEFGCFDLPFGKEIGNRRRLLFGFQKELGLGAALHALQRQIVAPEHRTCVGDEKQKGQRAFLVSPDKTEESSFFLHRPDYFLIDGSWKNSGR